MKIKVSGPKVPYHEMPAGMTLDEWQIALRKQFAANQKMEVKNIGSRNVYSDYTVYNEATGSTHKVAIRSRDKNINFCTCLDYKTNGLSTCKHIEYVKQHIEEHAINRKIFAQPFTPHYSSVYLEYGMARKIKVRIGTEKTEEFMALCAHYFDNDQVLKKEAYASFDTFLTQAQLIHPDFRCYDDALTYIIEQREKMHRQHIISEALQLDGKFFNKFVATPLWPFQHDGVAFALKAGRCLIADDMGLGKTLQAITTCEVMKALFNVQHVIIVCPTSLKYQWKSEIIKFTKSTVSIIEGSKVLRDSLYEQKNTFYNIVSYNAAMHDTEQINLAQYDMLVLDEAQRIKNWQTTTARQIKKIDTKHCIVLTGTPLEHKIDELYSIVQMVDPLKLGALFRFMHKHQIQDNATGKVIGYKNLHEIAEILQDVLLRRHKSTVLEQLPHRMEKNLLVPMTAKQNELYSIYYEGVTKLVQKWLTQKFLSESDRQHLLKGLSLMRMVCNSTFMVDQQTRHDTKVEEAMNIIEEVMVAGNEKIVVFSEWERMAHLISWELESRGIVHENLNANVPGSEREKMIANFNGNPLSRIFLSTDAGVVGLNMQAANIIINLDLPWNPAVLEQRIARVYRTGQSQNVQVINIIAANTIEHQMLSKLKINSSIAQGLLDNGGSSVFLDNSLFQELMHDLKHVIQHEEVPIVTHDTELEKKAMMANDGEGDAMKKQMAGEHEHDKTSVVSGQLSLFDENDIDMAPSKVIAQGVTFINNLINTLSDNTKSQMLVKELIKTDTLGNTYLHIPIKNKDAIENILKLFASAITKNTDGSQA